jgi:hypothetical protein
LIFHRTSCSRFTAIRYAEVEPLYKRAIAEKALGPDHLLVGTALNKLA